MHEAAHLAMKYTLVSHALFLASWDLASLRKQVSIVMGVRSPFYGSPCLWPFLLSVFYSVFKRDTEKAVVTIALAGT